jgi:hypothetical protein
MGTPKKPDTKKIAPESLDEDDEDDLETTPKKKVVEDDEDDFDAPLDDDLGFRDFDEDDDDDY